MNDNDTKNVLAANEAFYEAFRTQNHEAMDAIWSRNSDQAVFCLHPGREPLTNRADILLSWRQLAPIDISPANAQAFDLFGVSLVVLVTCDEDIKNAGDLSTADEVLVASNVFVREYTTHGWALVMHHAGRKP